MCSIEARSGVGNSPRLNVCTEVFWDLSLGSRLSMGTSIQGFKTFLPYAQGGSDHCRNGNGHSSLSGLVFGSGRAGSHAEAEPFGSQHWGTLVRHARARHQVPTVVLCMDWGLEGTQGL